MNAFLGGAQSPLVSLLIPVYNRETLIGPCIESALAQTVDDLEIIVSDNASTDATWETCQKYAARDSRVRIFRNCENIGPVHNWARCLAHARGRLGKFLFSDDQIYPHYLERTLSYMNDPRIGFVFSAVHLGPEPGEKCKVRYAWNNRPDIVRSSIFIYTELLLNSFVPFSAPSSPGAAVFRLRDLRKNLLWNFWSPTALHFAQNGAGPDLLFYLLTARDYPFVAHVNEPLGFFRMHRSSISISDGRTVKRQYWQTRLWFAKTYAGKQSYRRLLIMAWLSECIQARRLLPYSLVLHRFLDRGTTLSPLDISWLIGQMMVGLMRRFISSFS